MPKVQRKTASRKKATSAPKAKYKLALPLAVATAGIGAIILALYLANRKFEEIIDYDNAFDVENYDVMDKPYIYAICE